MKQSSFSKKRVIHAYIIFFIFIIIILIAMALMLKYHVEGEKNLPFNLKKISIISTAEPEINNDETGAWYANILQKNDIYFVIEKNSNYKKEEAIKKISFENFQITKSNNDIIISKYRPTTSVNTYNYSEEFKFENSLEYLGGQSTNTETMQINNQGGTIGFSIVTNNIGKYTFSQNEKVPSDGTLLTKASIQPDDINFNISFDLIIETESNKKFKSNITLDLPTGNILDDGVGILEDTKLENVIFKRF